MEDSWLMDDLGSACPKLPWIWSGPYGNLTNQKASPLWEQSNVQQLWSTWKQNTSFVLIGVMVSKSKYKKY